MIIVPNSWLAIVWLRKLSVFLLIICVPIQIFTQTAIRSKTNKEKVDELRALLNSRYTFQDLLNDNPEAVSIDEQIFALSDDAVTRQRIAGILVSVGVKDRRYFDYLSAEARRALNNPMPWPSTYDKQGRLNHEITPAFIAWCKKRGLDPNDSRYISYRPVSPTFLDWCLDRNLNLNNARYAAYYEIPAVWTDLAAAHDPRAYDLLIEGLHSHNLMIVAMAAKGLARLQDPRAIHELIATGKRVPGEARLGVAVALLYFSDDAAQAAANEFGEVLGNKELFQSMRAQARTQGVKALFPY